MGKITQTPQVNDAVGENIVFEQDPATGTDVPTSGNDHADLQPGRRRRSRSANFVGAQIADVKAALDQAKVPYQVTEVESDRPVGEVLAQDPAPGTGPRQHGRQADRRRAGCRRSSIPNVANTSVGGGRQPAAAASAS